MTEPLNAAPVAANAPGLPEKQRRLIELDDALLKYRIAPRDRPTDPPDEGNPIDPVWFNRARTAQRHLYLSVPNRSPMAAAGTAATR